MAMASSSSTTSSLPLTHPPLPSLNMEDLLRNIYPAGEMTLEDFLAKEGAGAEEDIRGLLSSEHNNPHPVGDDDGDVGRRRKRGVADPVDKVALQRQKRMIKNRESAARSRERKQAYTMELEALALKLEDENTELLKYQGEQDRVRLKELMEKVIPITEKKKPGRLLLRTLSM